MEAAAPTIHANAQSAEGDLSGPMRALLDHVAAELAAEYVRLMEAAASTETTAIAADVAA